MFDWQYIKQIIGGDFAKFCGLLRIYKLYIIKNENIHIYISFQHIVPLIVSQVEGDDEIVEFDEDLTHQLLVTLTNVAALTDWHHHYIASLPK